MEVDYKTLVLTFSTVAFLWEHYLYWRQHQNLLYSKLPNELKDLSIESKHSGNLDKNSSGKKLYSQKKFKESQAYGRDKSNYGFAHRTFMQAMTFALFSYNLLPYVWHAAGELTLRYAPAFCASSERFQSILWMGLITLAMFVLDLPFSYYYEFVIESRHGFNKQTVSSFVSDNVKKFALSLVIGTPLLYAFIAVTEYFGENFYWYVWLLLFAFQILAVTLYPTLIAPLFNTYTLLEPGKLRKRIELLAKRLHFPLTKLFVVDGSRRSSHSNAYLYGFFKNKRIVLFDTLMEHSSEQEIVAILGHELGHWKHSHVLSMLVISQIHLFLVLYVFSFFLNHAALYESFGFNGVQPVLVGFFLFQCVYAPMDLVLSILMNALSRHNEFQADAFAVGLGYATELKSGLLKLHLENLGNPVPDWLFSLCYYSHPPLIERLKAIDYEAFERPRNRMATVKMMIDAEVDDQ